MEEETKRLTTTPFLSLPFFMAQVRHRSMKAMTCSIVMFQNFRASALWVRSLPVCLWAMSCSCFIVSKRVSKVAYLGTEQIKGIRRRSRGRIKREIKCRNKRDKSITFKD